MGQSSPSSQTVTNKTEIDPVTSQWRNAIFQQGQNLYSQGAPSYYPGQTVAPYSPQTLQGLGMLEGQAQQGAIGLPQAYNAMNRSMSGYMPGMNTAMQASNGGMMNPFYGQIGMASNQNTAGQVAPILGMGLGSNPYANQIAQAGQGSVAGQLNPYINQIMASANAQSPYGQQIAALGQQQTTAGMDTLGRAGQGDFSHLDGLYSQGREQITKDLNARFAGAGRTGPNAAYGQQLGNSLGNLYTSVYAPGVEAERNRQFSAAGQLAGIQQQDRATAMGGLQTAAGMQSNTNALLNAAGLYSDALNSDYGRNLQAQTNAGQLAEGGYGRALQGAGLYGDLVGMDANRRYQGANDMAGLYGSDMATRLQGAQLGSNMWSQSNSDAAQGAALLPSLYQYGSMPGQSMLQAGGAYETMNQAMIDADMQRYNYGQNAQWDMLQRYAALMSGLPDFSSQTQTTTGPRTSRGMSLLGGAASGASMGGSIAGAPGAGIGAGIGALMGLFG